MDSLSSVTIDGGVIAVPKEDCTKDEVFQYIETLLDWSKLLKEPWVSVFILERSIESLIVSGMFPMRDKLKELFNKHGITEFDVNTVAKKATPLLSVTPSFENYYCIKEVLSENLLTDPIIEPLPHERLQSDLETCLILIAVLRKYCLQPLGGDVTYSKKGSSTIYSSKNADTLIGTF
ncbi:hypothetical protein [Legionella quinlivanii]|uniref:hypothetical protein n=1 Tax=Legionella quinlivanii TaxID=45073 RepID=UPI0022440828|nr:hypothetical protein [Legionella quinlivanii]MCW8452591.1 hypothetical protein [Legionella quinlivanii]